MGSKRRAPRPNLSYRTTPESQIIEMLKLGGFAFDIERGRVAQADFLARSALSVLIEQGLGYEHQACGVRCFDPVEVINTMKWLGLSQADNFWRDYYVATGRALVLEWASACRAGPPALRLRLKRIFGPQHFGDPGRWRLRLPLPLDGDPQSLSLTVVGVQEGRFSQVVSPGRFEVRCEGQTQEPVSLAADITLAPGAPEETADLSDEDRALYTHRSEGLIQVTPTIEALAAQLSAGAHEAQDAVRAFWSYLIDEMCCGAVRYGQCLTPSPIEACLQSRWYDCQLGAALLASLCRANGIPARLVGGYVAYRLAPTNHYWAEVWLPSGGWRMYDFLSWDLSAGGADAEWRDHFAGASDRRIVTERFPRQFTGLGSIRLPAHWQMVQYSWANGVAVDYLDLSGAKIYSDHIAMSYL